MVENNERENRLERRRYALLQAAATIQASPINFSKSPLDMAEDILAEIEKREYEVRKGAYK